MRIGLRDREYWNPYGLGVALGVTALAAFLLTAKGLGASGAFARFTAWGIHLVAPGWVESNGAFQSYFVGGSHPLDYWLVFLTIGTAIGGLVSGVLAGRNRTEVLRGPRSSVRLRLSLAFVGGILVGIGTRFARGCTSSQGIVGGGLMSVGSWVFLMSVFAGGFAMAWFVRREWT
jgi:uncharacterized membrane protein YedE/YeeE